MEKIYSVPTPGFPAESILLSTAYENHKFNDSPDGTGRVYLYFTCNKKPGTIYSFYDTPSTRESHVNDMSKLEFVKLSPAYREYNISSVITDRDGNLYFKNDSNHLFKVKSNKSYLDSMKLEAIDGTITMDKGMGLSPSDDFDSRISEYTGKQEGTSKAKLILKPAEGAKAEVNGIPYEDKPMEVSVKPDEKTVIEVTVTKDSSKRIYKIILRPKGTSADLKGIFVNYEVNVPPWTDGEFNVEIDKSFTSGVTDYSTILNEELKKKGGNIWFVADDPNSKIKVIPVENWDEARLNKDGYIPINSSKNMYQGGATFFSKLYPKDWNRDAKISIEVTSENGKASKKYNFTISNQYYVSGVQLNKDNISLETGKKEQLKPTVLPDNATNKEVTWKSSNNKIAYVDWRGNVKGISPGEAYITVTTKDKGYTAICKVTVVGGNADINPEWMQEEDGSWYVEQNGEKKTGWFEDKDTYPGWYYFDKTGRMQTGWVEVDGIWYYMDKSGKMSTGWLQQGGTWYYLKSSGAMATGWQDVGGTWYFFEKSGAMSTGWLQQGSTWYYLKSSGAMATGWLQQGGTWYYLKSSGAMATGWEQIGGTWYKFANNGAWIS
ncbi:Ig-like domain-containing protein [Eubacteriales bacterium KG127]